MEEEQVVKEKEDDEESSIEIDFSAMENENAESD